MQPRDALIVRDAGHPRARLRGAIGVGEFGDDGVAEEVDDRARDGRHAGADDAQIGFQSGPDPYVVVMVGCVGVFSDLGQVLQADDTADCDEETDEERQDGAEFASFVSDLKLQKLGDR